MEFIRKLLGSGTPAYASHTARGAHATTTPWTCPGAPQAQLSCPKGYVARPQHFNGACAVQSAPYCCGDSPNFYEYVPRTRMACVPAQRR